MVLESVGYFLRNGSETFTCFMDMTKAFDMIQHSRLFRKLIDTGLSLIFVRLLLVSYLLQHANVRWNSTISQCFSLANGVKQCGVLSAILYCFYVNGLFQLLRKRRTGCWIQGTFHGIFVYADDNVLLAPTTEALQEMIDTCLEYCNEHNLKFSTNPNPEKSKTKCLAFLFKKRDLSKLSLGEDKLPWVSTVKHLGNTIENTLNGQKKDILIKRAKFIDKNNELLQEFYFAHPDSLVKINLIYNSHFTGSVLWDLFSKECIMIENAWNVSVRKMFNIPRQTHRYLIQPMTKVPHIKTILIRRFLRFTEQLERCPKRIVGDLLNLVKYNVNSVTVSNLSQIMALCNKSSIIKLEVFDSNLVKYHPTPIEEGWRIDILRELIDTRFNCCVIDGFSTSELDDIMEYVCTS